MSYIVQKIIGLKKPSRIGHNTGRKHRTPYVHKVAIQGYVYWKVHIGRSDGSSKIKYFKKKTDAQMFLEFLKLNPYL